MNKMKSSKSLAKPHKSKKFIPIKRSYDSGDGWGRGSYSIPKLAIMGSSDTGMRDDSPAPTDRVKKELDNFRDFLKKHNIKTKYGKPSETGNVFSAKRWVQVVNSKDFDKAVKLADKYLKTKDTIYIHDAKDGLKKV